MLPVPNHCLSRACIQNIWSEHRCHLTVKINVFLCSIHTAVAGSFITPFLPRQIHQIIIFMWPGTFLEGDVDGGAASVDDSSASLSCWALSWEGLCAGEWRAACVWGMNHWARCAPKHVRVQSRNAKLLCTFLKEGFTQKQQAALFLYFAGKIS